MQFFKKNILLTIMLLILSFYVYKNYTRLVEGNSLIDKNSIQYVNSLYMSDGRIYNKFLTDIEKKLYLEYFNSVNNRKKSISFPLNSYDCKNYQECFNLISKIHHAILADHPELMSYSGYMARYKDDKITINFDYATLFSLLESIGELRIERIIDDIKNSTKEMSDIEKIKYVYKWMGVNNKYDKIFTYQSKNQSIYNVFIKHEAVCAGFAKASQVIFQNIGITSYAVTGNSTGPHMWNIVLVDGNYYYFDSTVATSFSSDNSSQFYWGLKQKNLKDYTLDYPEWYQFEISEKEIF